MNKIDKLKKEIKNGLKIDDAITRLDKFNFTITETMKFLVFEYNISLKEAKECVSQHPAWSELVNQTAPAHEEIIQALSSDKNKLK